MCNKGIVIVLGTADKAILIQIGRCNIKAAVKIKPDFIAGKAALPCAFSFYCSIYELCYQNNSTRPNSRSIRLQWKMPLSS